MDVYMCLYHLYIAIFVEVFLCSFACGNLELTLILCKTAGWAEMWTCMKVVLWIGYRTERGECLCRIFFQFSADVLLEDKYLRYWLLLSSRVWTEISCMKTCMKVLLIFVKLISFLDPLHCWCPRFRYKKNWWKEYSPGYFLFKMIATDEGNVENKDVNRRGESVVGNAKKEKRKIIMWRWDLNHARLVRNLDRSSLNQVSKKLIIPTTILK